MKQLLKEYGIAEDVSIERDYTDGYSIYITFEGVKVNLVDSDISRQHIIATLLMVLMNGKFNKCFKGEKMIVYYEPNYKPITIENPEYNLNEEHQDKFAGIIIFLSKELNTQIVIETQSKVIIDKFKEFGNATVYYFRRNVDKPADSPDVIEFGGN